MMRGTLLTVGIVTGVLITLVGGQINFPDHDSVATSFAQAGAVSNQEAGFATAQAGTIFNHGVGSATAQAGAVSNQEAGSATAQAGAVFNQGAGSAAQDTASFVQGVGSAAAQAAPTFAQANTGGLGVLKPDARQGEDPSSIIFFPREESKPQILCTTYEGKQGSCRLLVQCATFFAEIAELSRSPCAISTNQQGVCCPTTKQPITDVGGLISKLPQQRPIEFPSLELPQLNEACVKGLQQLSEKEAFETELLKNQVVAEKGSPVYFHAQLFQTTENIINKAKDAAKNVAASINLVKEFNLTKDQGGFGLPQFGIQNTVIENTCPKDPLCPKTKYRALDGVCNNRLHKDWGRAGTAFQRILAPDYDDGVDSPRLLSKATGKSLPSPRSISSRVIVDRDSLYDNFTILIMQWGQFLDHDITHTPITKGKNMSDITCCKSGQRRQPRELHPDCIPIEIPLEDNFYNQFGQRCMEFVRSMPAMRPKCNFGPREQMNQITSFIDASNVYGSNEDESKELQTFNNGLLKVNSVGHSLLPPNPTECQNSVGQEYCFKAGDSRVNEQPELAVVHTIWMRQHNKLAQELKKINPGWNDEIIYQEARRIVAAQIQHITYNEYLPIVLGRQFMETFGLVPQKQGYAPGYREDIDPSINNAFATAAFRYGHTLISGNMEGYSKFGTIDRKLRLSENQFSPFILYKPGGMDSLLRGLSIQPSQKFDHFFSKELTNHLFAGKNAFGMDLVALNIQRGRDHGLPDYNQWREICGLKHANDFSDLSDVMDANVITQLQQLYHHVNDIDIFIGGIAERPRAGSLLGHTFLCIVGDQFARLRLGDRFYYENGGLASSFSEAQLEQIRKTSLARIMCDNSDNLEMMQPLVFVQAQLINKRALCKVGNLIPKISLLPWKNEPVWA
ncbi:peroxidase-like [Homarus americanus]|uniref:peroxidase-like n=1 Tax=Homarus americanus TaxID=6706 RepID=UPI001C47DA6E|nr:peroxidase-like [Homarus americanus]